VIVLESVVSNFVAAYNDVAVANVNRIVMRNSERRIVATREIGYLSQNSQPEVQYLLDALRLGLHQRGLIEDRDIVIEYRFAQGKSERLVELAAELVQARVDVIVTTSDPFGLAARQVTTTIPIVMVAADDPVASGLAVSLAKPVAM